MRSVLLVLLLFGGCSNKIPDQSQVSQSNEADSAEAFCRDKTKKSNPNLVPGAFEVCISKQANSAVPEAREEICKRAKTWAGFMSDGKCFIDPE